MESEKDTSTHFTTASRMFKFKYNKPGSDISFDYEFDTIDDDISVISSVEESIDDNSEYLKKNNDVDHVINYSEVVNTKHNTKTWINVLDKYFIDTNLPENITQIIDQTELESILVNFFVVLKKQNGQPYAPSSIHNCYCAISRHLQKYSCIEPKPNIYNKNLFPRLYSTVDGKIKFVQDNNPHQVKKADSLSFNEIIQILNHEKMLEDTPIAITFRVYFWLCLLCGLRGGDARRLEFDHVKPTPGKSLQVVIPREKNHAGGIKNLHNAGRICEIPPDMNGKFTPVSDILYYMYRPLDRHSHEKMIREICHIISIDTNLKKITNHSIRRTAIQILTQLNVSTDRIMAFSSHRSPGGVASYQTFTRNILHNTVSMMIPSVEQDNTASLSNNQDITTIRSPLDSLLNNQETATIQSPLASLSITSSRQISSPILQKRIRAARKFKPFDASKPFISPLKSRNNSSLNVQVINNKAQQFHPFKSHDNDSSDIRIVEETQQILPSVSSNSIDNLPRVTIENCNNCKVEIKITLQK
ncbi:1657_t:CDS:2 [Dentiscutata heterogama]|uniref:1657_t:CDS:1 n=1 Tax=Dentiscutata heterogama TaxID=1316150 RepID=A0ACA9LWG0_9GLOM|nr:1657_t:CDS:2 [Dentiscutata heterogama]